MIVSNCVVTRYSLFCLPFRIEAVAESSTSISNNAESSKEDDVVVNSKIVETKRDLGGTFKCGFCQLTEHYDYKGSKPPFAPDISYEEDSYIMKDPFSLPNRGEVLVLGGDCSMCKKTVCLSCSIFYIKRLCQECATDNMQKLPLQLHTKIKGFSKYTSTIA